jgi:hypothetical protein
MSTWNLRCPTCAITTCDVPCSMFAIPACPDCSGERFLAPSGSMRKSGVFPFTTEHVNGQPMVINDITQLRKVESQYGVCFSAFNRDNVRDPSLLGGKYTMPKYRGDDEGFGR